jgi:hypothetical protein
LYIEWGKISHHITVIISDYIALFTIVKYH